MFVQTNDLRHAVPIPGGTAAWTVRSRSGIRLCIPEYVTEGHTMTIEEYYREESK